MDFWGDVEQNSPVFKHYIELAASDFKYLESKDFHLNVGSENIKVDFKLAELPNHMKMLALLASKLTNSASFVTTFTDLNSDNHRIPI